MAILAIRLYPDPVLRERAGEVTTVDDDVRKLVRDMRDTMIAAPGIGLAAPQVGVQRRVIVYDFGEGFQALVNPEIVEKSAEQETGDEGCLSIPGLSFPVPRAIWVRVRGLDEHGRRVEYEAEDLHAVVIQHEVDHLDGILFIDRIDPQLRKEAMRTLRERALSDGAPMAVAAPSTRL